MAKVVLAAKKRSGNGSADARRIRRTGRIPGVLYGRTGKSVSIDLNAKEFSAGLKNISASTIVKVEIDGESHDAFVKDTQRNIRDGNILHVDFYEVESGVVLRTRVSVHTEGNPVGVRDGGILELPLHEIEVECLPQDLPERIVVDISELKVNQSIHVRDLAIGENVRLISSADQVVALVKFAKADAASETADETSAETASAEVAAPEKK
jgi:large subunit ribosomal protein L25